MSILLHFCPTTGQEEHFSCPHCGDCAKKPNSADVVEIGCGCKVVTEKGICPLHSSASALLQALKKALGIIIWMSGSPDFSPGGQAHQGWLYGQEDIQTINETIKAAERVS